LNTEEREHALELATTLLDDLELGGLALDRAILRASRLARIVDDDDAVQWLRWEQQGFPSGDASLSWRRRTGRVFRDEAENVYIGALRMVSLVRTMEAELARSALPALSGDGIVTATSNILKHTAQIRNIVAKDAAILASVEGQIHSFVVRTFYGLRISTRQAGMFGDAQSRIDGLLRGLDEDFLRRIEAAYAGLTQGDPESISGAMNSGRRLIVAFADAVFPATDEVRRDGQGQAIKLGDQNRLNRIKAYIDDGVGGSRANRLKRAISDVYARVSTGVHSDVTAAEARSLYLSAYTLLGEMLELRASSEPGAEVNLG
jgi:hypothetical protein